MEYNKFSKAYESKDKQAKNKVFSFLNMLVHFPFPQKDIKKRHKKHEK